MRRLLPNLRTRERKATPKDYFMDCCHRINGVVRAGPARKPRFRRGDR